MAWPEAALSVEPPAIGWDAAQAARQTKKACRPKAFSDDLGQSRSFFPFASGGHSTARIAGYIVARRIACVKNNARL